ncbi:coiled-coil domain-containing protein mtmr15 [Diplodia corticola]|uniref:Fanconi-associated nuclease n=1 Tax=Diplodia corticola TaxID=236234 RepID=A0A1J9RPE9_9PEZI|nr:coiled-coil domain-containing protein mtmr15 [Diplodia corticola]OJD29445.1 coiled-coil domain-containing protein mtmr15 [Diplodia corticola]
MLGKKQTTLIPHPKSTNYDDDDDAPARPLKRIKRGEAGDAGSDYAHCPDSPKPAARSVIPDSDAESDDDEEDVDAPAPVARTDLESALPPVETDKEAIEAYEIQRASEDAERLDQDGRLREGKWVKGRSSIYVDAFNLALDTVLEEERHLFDEAEMEVFSQWRALDYEAQYLYVRLFLRKTSAWHRINRLGYHSDIADLDVAIAALQQARPLPDSKAPAQSNPGELEPPEGTALGPSFSFADRSEDHIDTLEEASSLLKLDELKALAKDAKVQGKNKQDLLRSFRKASQRQTGLGWVGLKRSDTDASTKSADGDPDSASTRENTPLPEDANRDAHWVRKIMSETGPCIRLSSPALKLFERVHLVFYRSTEWTEKSLTTIILARISRRNFPDYVVSRSANVFASRALLLEFEASLRTQFRVDNILEFNGTPGPRDLQLILDLFEEVYPRWLVLLQEEQAKEDSIYISGEGAYLRRLSPAWVYTRIVHKATYVLGKFKQHKREHELLTELLTQRLFHVSRRGAWYQRKALLEEHYMAALMPSEGLGEESQKRHWRQIALQTCEEGLQDHLVHQIYHYDLQKRVTKLEKALKIAKRFQHSFSHVRLATPVEVTIEGIRIERSPTPNPNNNTNTTTTTTTTTTNRRGAAIRRTVWLDEREGGGECSVEAMCLSHYRARGGGGGGWKGFHSEGGIVRTLFAYLFYDVLFAYVPHVFQTPFQTCPLDLHTDAFFAARRSAVDHRLARIANGGAAQLIRGVWDAHAERRTCVVGLDWGFDLGDLLEIAECFGGEALAAVCRVVAQEYGQRAGGVPDLFLWCPDRGEVMFAEVKSENDRLSDTQRLWIHVLTGAGVRVELCNAVAKEVRRV